MPGAGDVQDLDLPPDVTVRWLFREGRARGELLVPAVLDALAGVAAAPAGPPEEVDLDAGPLWEVPDPDATAGCYAWLAGEAGMVTRLRRRLVGDLGLPRGAVAFMGYWRDGVAA